MQPVDRDEIQAIRAELDGLRAQVDAVGSARGRTLWTWASRRPRMARRLTRAGLVALMLALPVVVSASHQFTDVPTSHTFHAAIDKVYDARLTAGCSASKFCPDANVTRGQMSAFLNRGLGRGALSVGGTGLADDWATLGPDDGVLAAVDLVHGGAPGGTGFVLVTASASAYTTLAGVCPCELGVWVVNGDTGEESAGAFQVISDIPAPPDGPPPATEWREGSATVSYLFTVQSGVTNTYLLGALIRPTTAPTGEVAGAEWNLTAVYVPFGATGGNTQPSSTQGSDGRRDR
jgi:S-layer family protein